MFWAVNIVSPGEREPVPVNTPLDCCCCCMVEFSKIRFIGGTMTVPVSRHHYGRETPRASASRRSSFTNTAPAGPNPSKRQRERESDKNASKHDRAPKPKSLQKVYSTLNRRADANYTCLAWRQHVDIIYDKKCLLLRQRTKT